LYYDESDEKVCNELPETNFKKDSDGDTTPFYIAIRGECSFVRKVRNMENIGVSVGIIIDATDQDVDTIVMSDDGTGGGIRIPSMLIGKRDGEELIKFLKEATNLELDSVAIMASFKMDKPDDRVEYDIWMTSSSDRALDFITDFSSFDEKFGDSALMTPRYVFWKCPFCEQEYLDNDCYAAGKYCAVETSNTKIKGREIILEDLRQKCLYQIEYNTSRTHHIWWDYIKTIHTNCYNVLNEDCSIMAHTKLGLNFQDT
jgi:hypothetical protein